MPDAEFVEMVEKLSQEFDGRTFERHVMGEEKYGKLTWADTNTIEMAIEEILDFANYARYTYVKLRLIQIQLAQAMHKIDEAIPEPKPDLGKDSFRMDLDK